MTTTRLPIPMDDVVNAVFDKYDVNRNGFLETEEILTMLMDAFKKTNRCRKVDEWDIKALIKVSSTSSRGRVNRK